MQYDSNFKFIHQNDERIQLGDIFLIIVIFNKLILQMNRLHPKGGVKSQALFGSEHTQRRGWGKHVFPPNYEVSTVDGVVLLLPNSMCLQITCSALSAQPLFFLYSLFGQFYLKDRSPNAA